MALPKKKKTKKIVLSVPRDYDRSHLGDEPKWFDSMPKADREIAILKTFNWYNYFFNVKDLKKDLIDYAKNDLKYSSDQLKLLREADDYSVKNSAGSYVRMIRNGWNPVQRELDVITSNLDEMMNSGRAKLATRVNDDQPTPVANKPNPQQFILDKFNNTIAQDLFDLESEWSEGNYKASFDAFSLIKQYDLKGPALNYILSWVEDQKVEFEIVLSGSDPDYKEAYSHMKKADVKAILNTLNSIISDVEKSKQTQKAVRTVRKKALPSIDKLLNKFIYKKEDHDLKIASVNPSKIVGSKRVLVYNTKYRDLTEFVAEGPDGLSIKKGTSYIERYSDLDSKTVSVPSKYVSELLNTAINKSSRQLNNFISNTMKKKPNNKVSRRVNQDVVILKVE